MAVPELREAEHLDSTGGTASLPDALDMDSLECPADPVHSIPNLTDAKRQSGDLERFKRAVFALGTTDTPTLVLRIANTADPLTLWALHVALDGRGVAPCLRWPANTSTAQMAFVTWLADLLWFTKRNLEHNPATKECQRLVKEKPGSNTWHSKAYWLFKGTAGKRSLARTGARSLRLTLAHRQELMMFPTTPLVAQRHALHPDRFAVTRECLYSHAMEHPDKSGQHSPLEVANRRAALWRTYVLSGRSPTVTAANWQALTGESLTRQAVSKQIQMVETALRERRNIREG